MFKIAICDDCPDFLAYMKEAVIKWGQSVPGFTVKCFTNGDELIASHTSLPFDAILLDIIMPLVNGIETAREIRNFDPCVKIVFLTASSDHAVESYTVKAYNYLLKPVDVNDLNKCLDELYKEKKAATRSIIVRSNRSTHRVELHRIEYVEAQNKHTILAMSDGTTIESIDLMHTYSDKLFLSDGFFKCHRGYIVNLYHIDNYTSKEIRTRSGYRIPISRSCQKEFEEVYFTTLFGEGGE